MTVRVLGADQPGGTGVQEMGRPSFTVRKSAAENRFVDYVLDACSEAGVTVQFRNHKFLADGDRGRFNADLRELVVATKAPGWFSTFVHEFCHLQQHLEGLWSTERAVSCWVDWVDWLAHTRDLRTSRLETVVRTIQECELDAERRTLAFAKKYEFPSIDPVRYARASNVYILNHEAARRVRTWCKSTIYRARSLLDSMPSSLIRSRYDKLPSGFMDTYRAYCAKSKLTEA